MTNFIEIAVSAPSEDGTLQQVRGLALKPYVDALNKVVGVTELHERKAAEAKGEPIPEQTIELNIDEHSQDYGFRILQHKIVLIGFWGTDHTRDSDIAAVGNEFPDAHLLITEAGMPKPNGDLSALKNYIRREYVRGEVVGTWAPEPIVWAKRGY